MHTTIVKWGNSRGVRLPKALLESVNLSESDPVEIVTDGDKIIIEKTKEEKCGIEALFEGYEGSSDVKEIDWGKPVGGEVW